ncbi:MAG: type II toxin-antitoxin system VapC family toxin [Steroidobacteraceae bacterium]
MKLLLDTHILVWALDDSPRLSATARALLQDERNELLVSAASFWELAIKMRLGKIALRFPLQEIERHALAQGCRALDITIRHTLAVGTVECSSADPFDRLLLAQCEVETLRLVTADAGLRGVASVLPV